MTSHSKFYRAIIACLFVSFLFWSCGPSKKHKKEPTQQAQNATATRDWNRFPAIVERNTKNEVIALGDVHGGYERLVNLLSTAGLIQPTAQPQTPYAWSGGNRILVCIGDLIDKGDHSIEVIDLMMALESQAPSAGGEVIVTMGNHEAEFLANPNNKKAGEFRDELQGKGIDPESLRRGEKSYGEWLMERPFAARINDWFFAHAGNSAGKTLDELASGLRSVVDRGEWSSPLLIGEDSLLEAREWWKGSGDAKQLLDDYLRALGAKHIVFGHDPSAFHDKGNIGEEKDGRIFLIDVGMSPAIDYSKGALLLIEVEDKHVVATVLNADGIKKVLWQGGAL